MTERKRAGARRTLAEAAAPKKPSRPIDDTTFPAHPDQTELLPAPPAGGEDAAPPAIAKQPRATARKGPSRRGPLRESPMRKSPAAAAEPAPTPAGIKYTAVLDHDTADAFDSLTRVARRRLGRHVSKLELLSELLLLAADDASLRDQLIDSLRRHAT